MKTKITYRQFDSAIKRAERSELNRCGKSLSACSIGSQATLMKHGARILCVNPHSRTMDMEGDWRSAVKLAAKDHS